MYPKKLVFMGKRRKIHIHPRAFKVVVGDPFAQYWCIDLGLLYQGQEKLRPWSELLGRENSDHGLSLACFGG